MKDFSPISATRLLGNRPVVILEIGANDGEDSSKFLQHFPNVKTRLFCFECDSRAIARWKKRIRDKRATLIESALSSEPGTSLFYPSDGKPPGISWRGYGEWDKSGSLLECDRHTEHSTWLSFKPPVEVNATTLDQWADATIPSTVIDFCWVDVQGAELLVLEGGFQTLPRIKYWYCECDPRPNYRHQARLDDLNDILLNAGFSYVSEYGGYNHLWKNNNLADTPESIAVRAASMKHLRSPVSVRFMGQFGNQLFQYVGGKIMADITGLYFEPPPTFLTKSGAPATWDKGPLFAMQPTPGDQPKTGPLLAYSGEHWIDWNEYQNKGAAKATIRSGYLQRYECLLPWKDKIKNEWLVPQQPFPDIDQDAVHVHCRRADYVPGVDNPNDPSRHGIASTLDEYAACLDKFPDAKRLVVYTDDTRDPWLAEFRKLGLPWSISGGTWDQDFMAMAAAKWLLIAQSTFSWWAGFLGNAEKIVCPLSKGTLWHYGKDLHGPAGKNRRDYPNLIVTDESRWEWVEL